MGGVGGSSSRVRSSGGSRLVLRRKVSARPLQDQVHMQCASSTLF